MIDYLRNYVVFYVQKIDALRRRKIMLLKKFRLIKNKLKKTQSIYFDTQFNNRRNKILQIIAKFIRTF